MKPGESKQPGQGQGKAVIHLHLILCPLASPGAWTWGRRWGHCLETPAALEVPESEVEINTVSQTCSIIFCPRGGPEAFLYLGTFHPHSVIKPSFLFPFLDLDGLFHFCNTTFLFLIKCTMLFLIIFLLFGVCDLYLVIQLTVYLPIHSFWTKPQTGEMWQRSGSSVYLGSTNPKLIPVCAGQKNKIHWGRMLVF